MKEVASEGSRGYEPSHFSREVVNFHSLLDHLADISIPSLSFQGIYSFNGIKVTKLPGTPELLSVTEKHKSP